MADIDIQEKKGSVWPWIVGLLALVLVIWGVTEMLGGDDEEQFATVPVTEEQPATMEPADAGMPTEVTQFEQECAAGSSAQEEMAAGHEFTQSCIQHLTAAMDAVIRRDTVNGAALSQELDQFRSQADQLTEDRESLEHSTYVRNVFTGAASLIGNIEESREAATGTLERRADSVRQAAEAVSTDQPMLEQREAVDEFFSEAAAALRALAGT